MIIKDPSVPDLAALRALWAEAEQRGHVRWLDAERAFNALPALLDEIERLRQLTPKGWGTCAACPRDVNGHTYPDRCQFADRYDHNIPWDIDEVGYWAP